MVNTNWHCRRENRDCSQHHLSTPDAAGTAATDRVKQTTTAAVSMETAEADWDQHLSAHCSWMEHVNNKCNLNGENGVDEIENGSEDTYDGERFDVEDADNEGLGKRSENTDDGDGSDVEDADDEASGSDNSDEEDGFDD